MFNVAFKTGHMATITKPTDIKPPFDEEKAKSKVKAAENAWNTCNPELVAHS
jgi:nuclear transport factor 2 (NTF2) superfamily protein